MGRASLNAALERMGIGSAFVGRVTAEDGMDTHAQQLLAAAIQLQRAPNRCVAFDACPLGVTAAHNCTMKVSLSGSLCAELCRQASAMPSEEVCEAVFVWLVRSWLMQTMPADCELGTVDLVASHSAPC